MPVTVDQLTGVDRQSSAISSQSRETEERRLSSKLLAAGCRLLPAVSNLGADGLFFPPSTLRALFRAVSPFRSSRSTIDISRVRRLVRGSPLDEEESRLSYVEPASGMVLLVSRDAAEFKTSHPQIGVRSGSARPMSYVPIHPLNSRAAGR